MKATGSVDAVITVDVSSQLSGRISDVFVNFNDEVKAGQAIARIDPELFAARVSESKASLQVAKANTQLHEAALRRAKVAIENAGTARKMAELQLSSAQAKQDDLERDYQRNLGLVRVNAVSDRDFTLSRTQRDAGATNLRAQAEEINMKGLAITVAEAEFSMAEANLHNAEAVVQGMADERFLILPHPEVAEYVRRKAENPGRWLAGMRRLVGMMDANQPS